MGRESRFGFKRDEADADRIGGPPASGHPRASSFDQRRAGVERQEAPGAKRIERSAENAGKRIVIVDDEEDIIAVLSLMVRKWGYVVEATASDGSQVVEAMEKKRMHPDLVLMDYRMKTMNGLEAAEQILLVDPTIKIIVESADDGIASKVTKAGLVFLQKPFTAVQLKSALSRALKSPKPEG